MVSVLSETQRLLEESQKDVEQLTELLSEQSSLHSAELEVYCSYI